MSIRQMVGDCRVTLPTLAAGSVQSAITSPPYHGLRDYGTPPLVWGGDAEHAHEWSTPGTLKIHAEQRGICGEGRPKNSIEVMRPGQHCSCGAWLGSLGLEPSVELYVEHIVECFRHVRRVLRDDGVLWLNLGDSYAGSGKGPTGHNGIQQQEKRAGFTSYRKNHTDAPAGYKAKDLMEIPSAVVKALQKPYYIGRIRDEGDRRWLAALVDGEGCIYIACSPIGARTGRDYKHHRTQNSYSPGLSISGLSHVLIERCAQIAGVGSVREFARPKYGRPGYVWTIGSSNARSLLIELYPYLVAKQQEARLAINCPPSGEVAMAAHEALKQIHKTGEASVDLPPPTLADLWESGWYLRARIPWLKRNSMPESVTDRPATSVEYVFLLAKSARYFWDADAVRSGYRPASVDRAKYAIDDIRSSVANEYRDGMQRHVGKNGGPTREHPEQNVNGRNRRNADWFFESWQGLMLDEADNPLALVVNPTGFKQAHFATFPPKLVEPMVKASSRPGDTILDPFAGAMTTLLVADRLGRNAIGCELKPEYADMGGHRLVGDAPLFVQVAD